jgi:DNA-binding NarL/FixJ family response regulator
MGSCLRRTRSKPIRLGIVEDHPIVAAGTASVLAATDGFDVAWTAPDLERARERIAEDTVDVVVVDVRLGTDSGLDLLREANGRPQASPERPAFVILTGFDYPQYRVAAARLGAAALVTKMARIEELIEAIARAASGERDLAPLAPPYPTDRDLEVVRLVAAGRTNAEIAGELDVSEKTIEGRLARLFDRLGVASRTELATRAIGEGWMELPGE